MHNFTPSGWRALNRLAALLTAALLLPLLAPAQSPPPSAAPEAAGSAGPVELAEYRIEPVSLYRDGWPAARFDFRILNRAEKYFDKLKLSDIKVFFDGQRVELKGDALRLTLNDPAHAIVLIDGSLSMVGRSGGVDKLAASRYALLSFLENLGTNDTISVYAFDAGVYNVSPRSSDKTLIADRVENFVPREDEDDLGGRYNQSTDLYGAIESLLQRAGKEKVRNLIVVSDGMQDTPEARDALDLSQTAFDNYKRGREQRIIQSAAKNGVRIFTIAIGDKDAEPKQPDNLAYVDADTLAAVSGAETAGLHKHIDPAKLGGQSRTPASPSFQTLLAKELENTFEALRQSFRYGYSLDMTLNDFPRDGREHTLELHFATGQGAFPAVKYPLFWRAGDNVPTTHEPEVISVSLLPQPRAEEMPINLGTIYAAGATGLIALALIPLLLMRVQSARHARAQAQAVSTSVLALKKSSAHLGGECPNDPERPLKAGDVIVVCPNPACGRAHHLDCWVYANSRCMVRYCDTELPIPAAVLEQHGLKPA